MLLVMLLLGSAVSVVWACWACRVKVRCSVVMLRLLVLCRFVLVVTWRGVALVLTAFALAVAVLMGVVVGVVTMCVTCV